MKHAVFKISIALALLMTTAVATPTHWRSIKPGVDYTKIEKLSGFHIGYLHAFRINLTQCRLKLAIAEDQRNKIAAVSDLTLLNKGIVGTNAGFFSQELRPLGLRISNHVQRYPLKSTPWWSVFYVVNDRAYIVSRKDFRPNKNIEFAVQSGPRLIVKGRIPISLKKGVDSRTALGITPDGKVILAVTDGLSLTTGELANMMKKPQIEGGLDCIDALNLDGGSSTQLYAKTDNFSLSIPSFSAVTDAVIVVPK